MEYFVSLMRVLSSMRRVYPQTVVREEISPASLTKLSNAARSRLGNIGKGMLHGA
ncbi:MAG: hypothetical protein M3272_00325 [Actinomycetota bacterium]|nr:hypothetical protein [Actinomycetota bacterium]